MSSPYAIFGTDKSLEKEKGVTIDYEGFSITILRAGGANTEFSRVLSNKLRPHRKKFDRGTLDDETSNNILIETYAEAVVIGWENVRDRYGKPLPFSVQNCVKLFTDLPDLFADIQSQAKDIALFRLENEGIEEKN